MKITNNITVSSAFRLNTRSCACGETIEPLVPINPAHSLAAHSNAALYSKQGVLKGIPALNKIKGLKYGFSTRSFGNMAFRFGELDQVVNNRSEFIKKFGSNIKKTVFMRPNHGKLIEFVDASHKGRGAIEVGTSIGPADAMITFEKNMALGLNSADCVPMIITTKKADVLALIHAGRLGTDSKIAKATIKKLISLGVDPKELVVGIGPSIQKTCYKLKYLETNSPYQWMPWIRPVLKSVKVLVEESIADGKRYRVKAQKGKILVDIIGFNVAQLLEMGVKPENIDVIPVCALCMARTGEIYSHFLSSQFKNSRLFPEGRFMSIAELG